MYIKIKKSKRNPVVFPFVLGGSKHFKIDPDIPLLNHNCSLRIPEDNQQQPNTWNEAVTRLSNIFTYSFQKLCKVTVPEDKGCVFSGNCHHFANYLAFGMDKQEDIDFLDWYENLPFASLLPFNEKDLKWGDIVQLLDKGNLEHSMFYIGSSSHKSRSGK
ncbi:hypothetical protein [Endozoicomonas sp. SCSIO W0465]|uniref:hypothetical protein n=1 Tax=Endozoicomonas sp. SCSIO W0465 TaxID=2918516 RepID=UPI0020759C8B|nr:hypothetical protein [Endozoicomonas sp. SCSIO W0465]USE35765.1 hypothetical protein MJO57_27490 [Endozoicomonas sp. SCSIO W0465]